MDFPIPAGSIVLPERLENGQFPEGVSGNKSGRPPSARNAVQHHKRKLEIAVRNSISSERIGKIISKMVELAEQGDKVAARLILDKFISNADNSDADEDNDQPTIKIIIENATFKATHKESSNTIDVQATEITNG